MSKKKRYEYTDHNDREEYYERRAKKKAMRDDHKNRWHYRPDMLESDDDIDDELNV